MPDIEKQLEKFAKRIEPKLPTLIANGHNSGLEAIIERERMDYRLKQFKKNQPNKYQAHKVKIATDFLTLRDDVNNWWQTSKRR